MTTRRREVLSSVCGSPLPASSGSLLQASAVGVDFRFGIRKASVTEALEALRTANSEFESRLRSVESQHWALPTPCPEWDVRALVNHVLLGTRMSVQVLAGLRREEVIAQLNDDLMPDGKDPVAVFADLADQMTEAFAGPNGLEGVVAHPAGDFPRSMFIGFRVTDAAAHAWDLATAIGTDTTLNAEMVKFLWDDALRRRADGEYSRISRQLSGRSRDGAAWRPVVDHDRARSARRSNPIPRVPCGVEDLGPHARPTPSTPPRDRRVASR